MRSGQEFEWVVAMARRLLGARPARLIVSCLLSIAGLAAVVGCRPDAPAVVVYAAQDRVFAEPLFEVFRRETGIEVRAVYDSEATKTTGLANRLVAESARPTADLWWCNEEMRTRQLAARGVLRPDWTTMGRRRRVVVVHSDQAAAIGASIRLASLTNAEYRGRVAMAYPVFGSTLTHLLVLRQRWGEDAWRAWCRGLADNRPLLVDGNSVVVRLVARGDALLGLTDSDDIAFARRDGLPVVGLPLSEEDGLDMPNTLALVRDAPRPDAGRRLAAFLTGEGTVAALVRAGAIDDEGPDGPPIAGRAPLEEAGWKRLLDSLDPTVRELQETFVR